MNITIGNPCIRNPKNQAPKKQPLDPKEVIKKVEKTIFGILLRK